MRAGSFTAIFIAVFTGAGIGVSYRLNGILNAYYCLLSLFFSINLLVCYWEACLFWRRDYIEKRADYWRERSTETGRPPSVEFLGAESR